MKRLLIVLGVLALLAGGLSLTLATTVGAHGTGPPPKTLVVVYGSLIFASDGTANVDKGLRVYQEWELWDTEGDIIGEVKFDAVVTEPAGTPGWYGPESFDIFGEGVIEGLSQGLPWRGVIIGGTGIFAGASGEYSGSGAGVTFSFENPLNDDDDDDDD